LWLKVKPIKRCFGYSAGEAKITQIALPPTQDPYPLNRTLTAVSIYMGKRGQKKKAIANANLER
jgi:hypothetical protein